MRFTSPHDLYSAREIALAAGVPEREVRAVLGPARDFVGHDEAVRIGRMLVGALNRQSAIGPQSAIRIPQCHSVP